MRDWISGRSKLKSDGLRFAHPSEWGVGEIAPIHQIQGVFWLAGSQPFFQKRTA
jgi:hypothetical protein